MELSLIVAFGILGAAALAGAAFGVWRYRNPVNPLTVFCLSDIGVFTLGSGIVAYFVQAELGFRYSPEAMATTAYISLAYVAGAVLPYLFRGRWFVLVYGRVLSGLGLASDSIASRYSAMRFALLVGAFVLCFLGLMVHTGAGVLWLTNSRSAYLLYREGMGIFWIPAQWFATFAFAYFLWTRAPRGPSLVVAILAASAAVYFLGSKGNIFIVLILALCYYHFRVRRVPTALLVGLVPVVFAASLALLVLQGAYGSMIESVVYFRDYFDTTALFISRFREFDYLWGGGRLSELWAFVPRSLVPGKPYEYGALLVHRVLFPGAAEVGYTPGYLPWMLSYLDFGIVGVFLDGLVHSLIQKTAYEYYLRSTRGFFAFLLMVHIALWPIWVLMPLLFLLPFSMLQLVFLRLRVAWPAAAPSAAGARAVG